jgi:hypothetical protein
MLNAEIAGSNASQHAVGNGNAATRIVVVDWGARIATAESLYGTPHPEIPYCWCNSVAIDPIMAEQEAAEGTGVITYPGGHAKITANYATDWAIGNHWPNGIGKPNHRDGTGLTLRVNYSSDFLRLPAREMRWDDNYNDDLDKARPDDESMVGRKLFAGATYDVRWVYVDDPPIERLRGAIGAVNESVFLGCQPETLLFLGFDLAPTAKASIADPGSWELAIKFQERTIKVGQNSLGWNHEYRGEDGWKRVRMYGESWEARYQKQDFSGLFA